MSCNNCASHTKQGTTAVKGCKSGGCQTDSCNKLGVFDWLSNISLPVGTEKFDCVEVRFKNSRKEFFRNSEKLTLQMGDVVATEAQVGYDVGIVTLTGELVRVQMNKKKVNIANPNLPKVYRKANQKDIEIWQEARAREEIVQKKSRELAIALGLEMKISDVEFQGDGSKATFYYTAEDRVDFRQLIKDMAKEFSTRIEMRQIGFRQEAARLGGIGSCGRELCCSTWLTDFRSVTTTAARYQQLSLNPQKLAGQCGKLKCCLNYELDSYMDALKDFPKMDVKLQTQKGVASCQKIDIFKRLMWFTYDDDFINWHQLSVEQVKEILAKNQRKELVASLEEYVGKNNEVSVEVAEIEQDSITRFDAPSSKKSKKAKKKTNASKENVSVKTEEKPKVEEKEVRKNQKNSNPKPLEKKENKTQEVAENQSLRKKNNSQKRRNFRKNTNSTLNQTEKK